MRYKAPKPAVGVEGEAGYKKAVSDRWECRKGSSCAQAEERGGNRYGRTEWHMRKKQAEPESKPAGQAPVKAANPAEQQSEPEPPRMLFQKGPIKTADLLEFWNKVRPMGFQRAEVFALAAEVLHGEGPAMTEDDFVALSKADVHKVFARLKEKHTAAPKKEGS